MSGSDAAASAFATMSEGSIVIFLLLMLYVIVGSTIEKKKLKFGHETGVVIIVGFIISYFAYLADKDKFINMVRFDGNLFFYLILPPIVFSSGYNMHRKKFFENIGYICFFGICGTIATYIFFTALTYLALNSFEMTKVVGATGEVVKLEITTKEILLMCSLLCSTDVIAAVSIVNFDKQPRLFSLIFGEGIINDAVCIILFNTVLKFTQSSEEVSGTTPFVILGDFAFLGFMSLLTGIFYAVVCSLCFKYIRLLTVSPINESMFIFCIAYLAYTTAELFHFSGIIALLTCGVVLAHYAWYNLSPQGKQVTSTAF
jgi:sodium/hydrogen exchanger-like protein 6/7/sodium/hydrogen exchanger 8